MQANRKLKSLDKLFWYKRRLKRFNERNDTRHKESEFILLYAIYKYQAERGASFEVIDEALRQVNRTKSAMEIRKGLSLLKDQGFIDVVRLRPERYRVTFYGINHLADVEAMIEGSRSKIKKK